MRNAAIITIAMLAALTGFYAASNWRPAGGDDEYPDKYDFARVGDFRPGFSHDTVSGTVDSIDNYSGKVVLLNFWATWCKPCREEMPMLQALQHEYGPEGFQVVGIALDDVVRVRDFVAELGIEYPNMVGSGDVILTGLNYGNSSGILPYSVLIDRQGTIRWREHGEINQRTFNKRLKQLL